MGSSVLTRGSQSFEVLSYQPYDKSTPNLQYVFLFRDCTRNILRSVDKPQCFCQVRICMVEISLSVAGYPSTTFFQLPIFLRYRKWSIPPKNQHFLFYLIWNSSHHTFFLRYLAYVANLLSYRFSSPNNSPCLLR